jgi:hypothetical protein
MRGSVDTKRILGCQPALPATNSRQRIFGRKKLRDGFAKHPKKQWEDTMTTRQLVSKTKVQSSLVSSPVVLLG